MICDSPAAKSNVEEDVVPTQDGNSSVIISMSSSGQVNGTGFIVGSGVVGFNVGSSVLNRNEYFLLANK